MTKYGSRNPEAADARQKRMKKSPKRQKRNPFACEGWGRFHAQRSRSRGVPGSRAGPRHSHWRNAALIQMVSRGNRNRRSDPL